MKAKNILSILLILCTVSLCAQKVKVKKGTILVDKKETPIKVAVQDGEYIFTDTANNVDFVKVDYQIYKIDENKRFEWLVLKKDGSEFENEIDMKYLSFTLNMKKAIAEFIMKELDFFDVNGTVNNDKINDYFSQKRERESKSEYEELVSAAKASAEEYAATEKLNIDADAESKEISRAGEVIGSYRFADANTIIIRDLDTYKIGVITRGANSSVNIASKLLTSPIKYDTKNRFSATDTYATKEFVIEAVRRMHVRGLELGHSAKETVAQVNEEAKTEALKSYEEAKENSSNIYDQLGYGIDDDGQRYEGKVTMLFEEIKNPADPMANGTMVNVGGSDIGKKVKIIYINDKDKTKIKFLSAKKATRFCLFDKEGNEACYEGVKVKSNGLLAGGGDALSIGGAGAVYMKVIMKEGKVTLYQESPSNKYYIRTDSQEKAFDFHFGGLIKEEKKVLKLKDYLDGCDYGDGTYDEESFKNIEKIKELINFYNNSCK